MKFGQVQNPENIDFNLPDDHKRTEEILKNKATNHDLNVYVGCAKWNRQDLKNFYPRGTKDELAYYSNQFNSIELNATFYRMFNADQIISWRNKTPDNFKFFPKINQTISHYRRLINVKDLTEEYCDYISNFEYKLGMAFLQLHDNFGYKNIDRLVSYIEEFPKAIPLAVEMRNTEWFNDEKIADQVCNLLEKHDKTNIIVDTAGRRDLLHMRLTTSVAFIRYVGANNAESDRSRLDDWIKRLKKWVELGLRDIYFFVHQNIERESPLLSSYFIDNINRELSTNLKKPQLL
ncbi:DUF72 domain-containing protein [Sunxiuqinia sp. A32]|uniref:DUF72 domain-containing protein n=1 Tax=Sunxiuqinia sp. A32 TaxID=3461496 RepID=UPI0040458427